VLVAAMLGSFRIGPAGEPLLVAVQRFVVLAGALVALLVVRRGAELRRTYEVTRDGLVVSHGRRRESLRFEEIDRLDYAAPFAGTPNWLPATLLLDRQGTVWRLSALTTRADEMIAELLARAGRSDLESWAEACRIAPRMARWRLRVWLGHAIAGTILAVAAGYYLLG
jgi:hypothetical protein